MTFHSACPVLRVSDYARARRFYTDILGFDVVEEAGEPVAGFGIFRAGSAQIFLIAWNGPEAEYHAWRVYLYPENLDAFVDTLRDAGQSFKGPTKTEYGTREVELSDPDGNVLCFGQVAG